MQEIMIGFTEEQYKVIDEYLKQYECETVQEAIIKAIEHYMAEH